MLGRPLPVGPTGPVLLRRDARQRVCIVLLSGIGDIVHGLPLANDLRAAAPDAEVTWVAEPVPAQVLRHHPSVDRVVAYRRHRGAGGVLELRRSLRGYHADLTLNVQRYLKSVWPTLLSGAPVRVGLPSPKTRDGIRLAHTHALEDRPWGHVQDLFLDFRWALGVPRDAPVVWGVALSPEEREAQSRFFAALGVGRRTGLVLASANPRKDWCPERWATLAASLVADLGHTVLLLGAPGPRARAAADLALAAAGAGARDCLADDLRRLMWLVDGCDLIVSPDTGPLHLAHALATPVVGLFGHTNPARVGPYARYRDLVVDRYTEPGASPDPTAYHPRLDRMGAIRVADVVEKVEAALVRYG